jgi:hypothetical protein
MVPAWFAAKLTLPGAHSSAGERPLHTREVPGSIPGAPTKKGPGDGVFLFSGTATKGGVAAALQAARVHGDRIVVPLSTNGQSLAGLPGTSLR